MLSVASPSCKRQRCNPVTKRVASQKVFFMLEVMTYLMSFLSVDELEKVAKVSCDLWKAVCLFKYRFLSVEVDGLYTFMCDISIDGIPVLSPTRGHRIELP